MRRQKSESERMEIREETAEHQMVRSHSASVDRTTGSSCLRTGQIKRVWAGIGDFWMVLFPERKGLPVSSIYLAECPSAPLTSPLWSGLQSEGYNYDNFHRLPSRPCTPCAEMRRCWAVDERNVPARSEWRNSVLYFYSSWPNFESFQCWPLTPAGHKQ